MSAIAHCVVVDGWARARAHILSWSCDLTVQEPNTLPIRRVHGRYPSLLPRQPDNMDARPRHLG